MKAATLRDELVASLHELAWDQWSQLGVSAPARERREERTADPEALLLFTLEIGRSEPRLFDEVLDWLAINEPWVSVHRLRNLCVTPTDRALADSALAWVARSRGRERPPMNPGPGHEADDLQPLFPGLAVPASDLDPAFARYGLSRPRLERSGKSQQPRLQDPISFAFRLRRLLGLGVRAEAMRTLLTIRAPRLSGRVITASAGFAQRNVREGLTHLVESGVISVAELSDDRYYSTSTADWAALLGLASVPDLPLHYDWIPTYRALTRIVRWLQEPGLDDLSEYLLASQARTLVLEIEPDLRFIGVPLEAFGAQGADFWDDFVEISRFVAGEARRPRQLSTAPPPRTPAPRSAARR